MPTLTEVGKNWEGRVVDAEFQLGQCLGVSDHSAVFLTESKISSPQKAVIKLIPAEDLTHKDQDSQLALWSRAAQLAHPNLLRLFQCGACQIEDRRFLYIVMECADEDLSQVLPQRALATEEVAEMLPCVAEALDYLHRSSFVHTRLKPSNVMAVGDQLKLSIDGVQKDTAKNVGEQGGTKAASYDTTKRDTAFTKSGDVWALGALLVTVLTQHEPKMRGDGSADVPSSVPEPFRTTAQRALSVDPRQRPTIAEILGRPAPAISREQVVKPTRAKPTRTELEEDIRPNKKPSGRWVVFAITAILALVVIFATQRFLAEKPPRAPDTAPATANQNEGSSSHAPSPEPSPALAPTQPASSAKPTQTGSAAGSVAHEVSPEASQSARNTIRGHVRINLQVTVDASGNVTDASPVAPVTSQYFARQARTAALGWKFHPPQVGGRSTPSSWVLHFEFGPASTRQSATQIKR